MSEYESLTALAQEITVTGEMLRQQAERLGLQAKQIGDRARFQAAMAAARARLLPFVAEIDKQLAVAGLSGFAAVTYLEDAGFDQIRVTLGPNGGWSNERMLIVEDSFCDYARVGIYPCYKDQLEGSGVILPLGEGKPMLDSDALGPVRVAEQVVILIQFALDR